ncbi:hypothetical protein FRC06_002953 [Ceratobasidium sp. 370]|nr:hypothetical protein FRC06_002953 [Ceratobasidium sp. 370]
MNDMLHSTAERPCTTPCLPILSRILLQPRVGRRRGSHALDVDVVCVAVDRQAELAIQIAGSHALDIDVVCVAVDRQAELAIQIAGSHALDIDVVCVAVNRQAELAIQIAATCWALTRFVGIPQHIHDALLHMDRLRVYAITREMTVLAIFPPTP